MDGIDKLTIILGSIFFILSIVALYVYIQENKR